MIIFRYFQSMLSLPICSMHAKPLLKGVFSKRKEFAPKGIIYLIIRYYCEYEKKKRVPSRALEILKSESVQPMTSSMCPFLKTNMSPVTKTNDNWQSYKTVSIIHLNSVI